MIKFNTYNEMKNPFDEIEEDFKVGDTCIYLKNGGISNTVWDWNADTRQGTDVKTVMGPEYFGEKCEILRIDNKVFNLKTKYKIKFLTDNVITWCYKEQLKKSKISIDDKLPKRDFDIKYQILSDTNTSVLKWRKMEINRELYRCVKKIEGTKSFLRLDLEKISNEWMLNIYFHRYEDMTGVIIKRLNPGPIITTKIIGNAK